MADFNMTEANRGELMLLQLQMTEVMTQNAVLLAKIQNKQRKRRQAKQKAEEKRSRREEKKEEKKCVGTKVAAKKTKAGPIY